jgi:hypothetical protein
MYKIRVAAASLLLLVLVTSNCQAWPWNITQESKNVIETKWIKIDSFTGDGGDDITTYMMTIPEGMLYMVSKKVYGPGGESIAEAVGITFIPTGRKT